ncbi:hypothetical protein BHM03_00051029 [Ensete ventricosum]|nr:hypothetical protein BHM03_00051029 [Ensete ventricosum]
MATEQLHLPSVPIFLCSLLLFLIFTKRVVATFKSPKARPPPGPWNLPLIGSLHHLVGQLPFRAFRRLARKHGPLMLVRIGQVDAAVASSREAAEEILRKHGATFASRPELAATQVVLYGASDIGWSPYGPYWKQLRRLCFMELLGAKRTRSFSSVRMELTHELMRDISGSGAAPVNLSDKLFRLSNAIVCRAAFGKHREHRESFIPIVKETFQVLGGFCLADTFPSLKFLDALTGVTSKMHRLHRRMDKVLCEIIKEHQDKVNDGEQVEEVKDLVDVLLRLKDDPQLEIPLTMDNIKAVILVRPDRLSCVTLILIKYSCIKISSSLARAQDMFVAGTDTASTVLEWTMSELMRHPSVMERAQKEVREALKGKNRVEESDMGKLNYMKLIVKETLRLHPPLPLLPRVCRETCQVMGYEIDAGTRVFINAWAICRDPRYWDDADSFKPERFEGSSIGFNGSEFHYLPFGGGRRICPGIGFGLAVVELALASLLFHFDWKLPGGMKPEEVDMRETMSLVVARKTELQLHATSRIPVPATI